MRAFIDARTGALDTLIHDARNPLTSIQGCAMTLLERDDLPNETRRALTSVIVRQAEQLDMLLRSMEQPAGSRQAM